MGMFTYVIKISSKILPLSYPFVDICLQDWSSVFAEIAFTHDTFHSNLRKTDVFPLTSRCTKIEQRKAKYFYKTLRAITRGFLLLPTWLFKVCAPLLRSQTL